jgi:hypothetical protein
MATSELVDRDRLDDDAGGDAAPAPGPDGAAPRRWWGWVVLGLVVLPLVVSAVYLRLGHDGYQAVGDLALAELQTRDVGHNWLELGPYSRDGWSHPGPALFYALAPLYRLLGSVGINLSVAALAVNAAAVAGMALVARRRGGMPLMLITLVALALTLRSLGPDHTRIAWNPWITVLPYGLLVFLTWALTCGERWALPAAVVVAGAVAQTHVGYVALALPLVVVGAVWLVAATPGDSRRRLLVPAVAALAAVVVMWFPPLLEQASNDPGNLRHSASWFREGGPAGEGPNTLTTGWNTVVTSQWSVPPEWAFGTREVADTAELASKYDPRQPVLLAAVAVAAWYLIRRRVPGAVQLVAVWAAATVLAVVATARTVGGLYAYRMDFTLVLGMVGGIIVAWAGWTALEAWRPSPTRLRPVLGAVALAAVGALAVVSSVAHVRAGEPASHDAGMVRTLVPQVVDGLPPGEGDVVVAGGSFGGVVYRSAVVLGLEKAGIDAYLPEGVTDAGRQRAFGGDDPVRARLLVAADLEVATFTDEGLELIAYAGTLTLDELMDRAPATRELEAARDQGDASGFEDGDEIRAATIPDGSAVGVFLEEPVPGS